MSLHSKIEPAAINIERDITKCLTCHGFFASRKTGSSKQWMYFGVQVLRSSISVKECSVG